MLSRIGRRLPTSSFVVGAVFAVICAGMGAQPVAAKGAAVVFDELVTNAPDATAVAKLPSGKIRFALRAGRVADVDPSTGKVTTVANIAVRTDGQRGLLGLDVDDRGQTVLSWVPRDGRLRVGMLNESNPNVPQVIYTGPMTKDRANGGSIRIAKKRRSVVMSIGDLLLGGRKGTFVEIPLPMPGSSAATAVLSKGWNNPFAFDLSEGSSWPPTIIVADNTGGDEFETIRDLTKTYGSFSKETAPAGLAILRTGARAEVAVCGYVSNELVRYRLETNKLVTLETMSDDCSVVTRMMPDRRLVYSTETGLKISRAPVT